MEENKFNITTITTITITTITIYGRRLKILNNLWLLLVVSRCNLDPSYQQNNLMPMYHTSGGGINTL